MVFSASYRVSTLDTGTPYAYFFKQVTWIALGVIVMVVAMRVPYHFWERISIPLMGVALLLLVAVLAFGDVRYGATRTLFGGSVQPSEPAKIAIIIYVSAWLASKGSRIRDVQVGLIPFAVLMGIITVLLVSQPAISTTILIVATAFIMFFIAGAELRQLILLGLGSAGTFWLILQYSDHARDRITKYTASFWNPLESQEWQTAQTLRAVLNGGFLGQGLGNGEYKLGRVPLGWSDNIFAVVGEELGLLGALLVIFLFSLLVYRGLRTALRAPDTFGMLLATGITTLLTLQALLSIAVVLAISPPTGVALPLISYGGSSLVTVMGAIGILLNVSRNADQASPVGTNQQDSYARFNFGWGNGRSRVSGAGGSAASGAAGRNAGPGQAPNTRRT
jgi:cell division protein FtsW